MYPQPLQNTGYDLVIIACIPKVVGFRMERFELLALCVLSCVTVQSGLHPFYCDSSLI